MKVMCIDARQILDPVPELKEGAIYTAKQDPNHEDQYSIFETGKNYLKKRFIPLSEIDETEFERNYNYQYHEQI